MSVNCKPRLGMLDNIRRFTCEMKAEGAKPIKDRDVETVNCIIVRVDKNMGGINCYFVAAAAAAL